MSYRVTIGHAGSPPAFRPSTTATLVLGGILAVAAMQNLDAIKAMHDRLDVLFGQPRSQWPKAELFSGLDPAGGTRPADARWSAGQRWESGPCA